MSRRDIKRERIRDALAETLVKRVRERLRGSYDLGVTVLRRKPGIHVRARINETVVERVLWPRSITRDVDLLADELVELRRRCSP